MGEHLREEEHSFLEGVVGLFEELSCHVAGTQTEGRATPKRLEEADQAAFGLRILVCL